MKKLLMAVFLLTASAAIVSITSETVYASGKTSTKIPASQVPMAVKVSFKSMYSSATQVQWETSTVYYGGTTYSAGFYLGTVKWEATYYADGTFIAARPK